MADQISASRFRFRAIPIAFGLAFVFAALQVALYLSAASLSLRFDNILGAAFGVLFLWVHAIFVLLIADIARPPQTPVRISSRLIASAALATLFGAVTWLNNVSNFYSCGEGHIIRYNNLPMLPWIWIGWAVVTLLALPEHFAAWASGRWAHLKPLWVRALWMVPFVPLVWFFGYAFQALPPDCTGPQEGWGLFEGGIVLFPLLGIFLFVMSTAMALLMAIYRK